jgi:hypothetical protein
MGANEEVWRGESASVKKTEVESDEYEPSR